VSFLPSQMVVLHYSLHCADVGFLDCSILFGKDIMSCPLVLSCSR